MRYLLLLTLAALPLAASAQARNLTSAAPDLTLSAAMHGVSIRAMDPDASLNEDVRVTLTQSPDAYAEDQSSALGMVMGNPDQETAPALTKWAPVQVPAADKAAVADKAVAVKMLVNGAGAPQNLKIAKAVNPEVDQIALAAMKQYRFSPATINHVPVDAPVTVTVTFE